ncbi:MAG: DUF4249 domain-containing protein [Flavobacteriales bacterium]|nr:DUF4249 domain-containing protein [Flavobacteriales bacterium]
MRGIKTLISLVIIFSFACTEKVDFPLPEDGGQRLVVDGTITDETKAHQVKLSYSSKFNSSVIPSVENAVVFITEGTDRHLLQGKGRGIYETDPLVKGEIGKTYFLEVTLQNGETYRAKSTMQAIGSIDSLRVELKKETGEEEEYYSIIGDATILSEYFMVETEINGQRDGTIRDVSFEDSKYLVNGQIIDTEIGYVEQDNSNLISGNNTINIRMVSIDQNYREFVSAFQLQLDNGDFLGGLFDGPVANVPTNISNGALGAFGAFAVAQREVQIQK